jgi:ABC-type polysaccharide/polyol phosphate transport system ATPase subunit
MLHYGIAPTRTTLAILLFLLLAATTALCAGLFLATLNVRYRDVGYTVPFFAQLWFFVTPVAYPSSLVPERWRLLYGIWALRQISVEIKRGDVVGIVGDNGSGKTTFLRILSQIVYPTEGLAEIRGTVATLLDVGAAFHGELTGRDNIHLNGTLLGMTRVALEHKFAEIVAFAELEKFVDTALKYYSSGMCVRLAFAVAAHVESEILLVDEALAVADAPFQKRCLEKMVTAGRQGRTVLLVSHDLELIHLLCQRVLVFAGGRIVQTGLASDGMDYYRAVLGHRQLKQIEASTGVS